MRILIVGLALVMSCQSGGILNPELNVDKGTHDKPHASLGRKITEVWTSTTHESAVKGKTPLEGKVVTVVGEVIDLSCYLQLGKHGAAHRDCAQKCMKNGQPIALLDKDGGIYILMEEEHHPRRDSQTNLREKLIENAACIIEVTGTLSTVGGYKAIFVQGFLKK